MKHLARLGAFSLAAVLVASCAAETPSVTIQYAEFRARLDNGLKMVIIPDKTTSLVHVDVRYEVGSNEDPPGKAGIAHYVEHMMFQHRMLGPDKPPTFQILPQITLGYNAYTTYDQTHYYLIGPKEDLETLLKIEAFRLNALCETVPDSEFPRELEVVRNEIRQRMGTPEGLIPQIVSQEVYPEGHPYSHMTGGDDKQLASITKDDVCGFMEKYYTPDRATVIVTGNVEPEAAGRMVKSIFGGIEARKGGERVAVKPIELDYKKVEHELDIERTQIWAVWKLPPRNSKDWNKVNALGSVVGRLAQDAAEWEFASDVQVTTWGGQLAPTFAIIMELPPGGDADEALDWLWKKTDNASWGLKHADFDKDTKAFLKMSFVEQIEPLAMRAGLVADKIQFGGGEVKFDGGGEYLMEDFFDIDELSADGFASFAKNTLKKSKANVIVFKPSKTGKKGDIRAKLAYSAKSHEEPEPIVDPAEAFQPLAAPKSNSILASAESYTLGNGMKVMLLPTEGLPIVQANLTFDVGGAHEPADKAGLANAAAEFLSPELDANFTAFVNIRGFADDDHTMFQARGLSMYTEVIVKGLERYIKIGTYNQEALERWQKRTKDRYKSADFRRGLEYDRTTYAALYGADHPYTIKGAATPESVGKVGYDAVQDWKRKHYNAKNATLTVVGNFNVAKVKSLISDNFGSWDGGSEAKPVAATQRARDKAEHIGVIGEKRPQMQVTIAYPAPAGVDGQQAARIVLAEMMNMRMAEIRTELGSTYGTYAGWARAIGPGSYQIGGSVDGMRAGESLKAMRTKIDELREGKNFERTFALARRKVLKSLVTEASDTRSLSGRLGAIAAFGLEPDHYDKLVKYVAAVSPAQVKALIESELRPELEVVVCMADRDTLQRAFDEAGMTAVQYVEPK